MPATDQKPLTREGCRAYLDETTFRLAPSDYRRQYPKWKGMVGVEIEMLLVRPAPPGGANRAPLPVRLAAPDREGDLVSTAVIRRFATDRGLKIEDTVGDDGHPLLLRVELPATATAGAGAISFEPGGQIEFSSVPFPCLAEAIRAMRGTQSWLGELFRPHGAQFAQLGINPWHDLQTIGLQMRKGRYLAMDRYFGARHPEGRRMMRQTCTVQVNLDFGHDEATLVRRYIASQLLAAVAAATFAFSPVVDGRQRPERSVRNWVWRHTDPGRTGLIGIDRYATMPSRSQCIDDYLAFALAAPVVFVAGRDYLVPDVGVTFGDWLATPIAGLSPTLDDLATHLSLLFPEVRPRGFLELRSFDCQSRLFEAVPAAYTVGLLYDDQALDGLLQLLWPLRAAMPELLNRAPMGLADERLATLAKKVMELAQAGLARLSSCFKADGIEAELTAFAQHFTDRGRTPADDLLDRLVAVGHSAPTLSDLDHLESTWSSLAPLGSGAGTGR